MAARRPRTVLARSRTKRAIEENVAPSVRLVGGADPESLFPGRARHAERGEPVYPGYRVGAEATLEEVVRAALGATPPPRCREPQALWRRRPARQAVRA